MTATTFDQFDQMQRRADRTLGVVYLFKHVRNALVCAAAMVAIRFMLRRLIESLPPERLDMLTDEQALDVTKKLQEVHGNLLRLFRSPGCDELRCSWLYRASLNALEECTEDLGDVIEDLVLAQDGSFRGLISGCVSAISPAAPVGTVARM